MALPLPVLTAIFLFLARFLYPLARGLWFLLRHKAWFLVALLAIFMGPLDFIGDKILDGLSWLVPELQSVLQAAKQVDVRQMSGAIAKIGAGAALANCVIAIDAFVAVGIALGSFIVVVLGARAAIFFYSMLPGKAT